VSGFLPKAYYTRTCAGGQTPVGKEREREEESKTGGGGREAFNRLII